MRATGTLNLFLMENPVTVCFFDGKSCKCWFLHTYTQGQEEIVELLLDYGLEIMVTNLYGETPLHIACRRGNIGES